MAAQENVHPKVYFFKIDDDNKTGYSYFCSVHERERATRSSALDDIVNERVETQWTDVTSNHTRGGFSMFISRKTQALIFIQLPTRKLNTIVFGSRGTADLDVKSKLTNPFIQGCKTYPYDSDGSGRHLLCGFEINTAGASAKVGLPEEKVERLPIMFDFVDTNTGVSPVFLGKHAHVTHGGIHPPTATTMIELTDNEAPQA